MPYEYNSLQSATKGLLGESVKIAQGTGKDFVVIGGWSPFLLNNGNITHPGTRDVDLLFKHGATSEELKDVVKAFLSRGYLSSAKHSFQLLKPIMVSGTEFVFNIDLLHSANNENTEMFVDHLTIDEGELLFRYQSIKVPLSTLLFEPSGRTQFTCEIMLPSGNAEQIPIPLMSELGTLLTKSESMLQPKRSRDVFDVMLAIVQARNPADLSEAIISNHVSDRLKNLETIPSDLKLRKNLEKHWPKCNMTLEQAMKKLVEFNEEIY